MIAIFYWICNYHCLFQNDFPKNTSSVNGEFMVLYVVYKMEISHVALTQMSLSHLLSAITFYFK